MSNKFIPNSFQVPNVLVDSYIEELSSHSFKLMLFIIRKTRGWQKPKDSISTTQLAKVLGLKKIENVYPYVKELEALNLIRVHKKRGKVNQYSLGTNFDKPVPKKGTLQKAVLKQLITKGFFLIFMKDGKAKSESLKQSMNTSPNCTMIGKRYYLNWLM